MSTLSAHVAQFRGRRDAEIAVVGAGAAASAVALPFAQRGTVVVLLEAEGPVRPEARVEILPSTARDGLLNVAAIRSTDLTASLGIAERVPSIVERLGVRLRDERPLLPDSPLPASGP